ncbi:MAG: hypothetical protein AAFU60_01370, partial [Bacteroidota bacterium]
MNKQLIFFLWMFLLPLTTSFGQSTICIEFEDFSASQYGVATGEMPGEQIYEQDGITIALEEFVYTDGTTGFFNAFLGEFFPPNPLALGNQILPSNVNLLVDYTGINNFSIDNVSFVYFDGGG